MPKRITPSSDAHASALEKQRVRARRFLAKNPKYGVARDRLSRLGVTPEQYDSMHKDQNGLCAVCHKPESATRRGVVKSLAVDHCHVTGKIRGLLCQRCNIALGMLGDDAAVIASLASYVTR